MRIITNVLGMGFPSHSILRRLLYIDYQKGIKRNDTSVCYNTRVRLYCGVMRVVTAVRWREALDRPRPRPLVGGNTTQVDNLRPPNTVNLYQLFSEFQYNLSRSSCNLWGEVLPPPPPRPFLDAVTEGI